MTTPRPELPLWELVQTAHVVARRLAEVFAEAGLTPAQFGVPACRWLRSLNRSGTQTTRGKSLPSLVGV